MPKSNTVGCPHLDSQVRISCHKDLLSEECKSAAQLSQWSCGRARCKEICKAEVKEFTGFEPVLVWA